jgi:hypothetical protein
MKAQSFFGGTTPHDKATKSKYKGNTGTASGGGLNIQRKTTVKQAGVTHGPGKNTSKQHRDPHLTTKEIHGRPNLPGKVDNRNKAL